MNDLLLCVRGSRLKPIKFLPTNHTKKNWQNCLNRKKQFPLHEFYCFRKVSQRTSCIQLKSCIENIVYAAVCKNPNYLTALKKRLKKPQNPVLFPVPVKLQNLSHPRNSRIVLAVAGGRDGIKCTLRLYVTAPFKRRRRKNNACHS